ncbi:MAG: NAD(P)H-dependent oxidoreductase [Alphaproteobacteria bacterium]|nr:NAD(P)H-dependent oxidoreductase [Alphaproteobacteria bacterium]
MTRRILCFAGSSRKDSINKKLARYAAEQLHSMNCQATFLDLADYPLPLYDGDLEANQGVPENAHRLKKIFQEHDGFFIASPEHNSTYSALLKNTIDWISRIQEPGEPPLAAFAGKVAGIAAASPGAWGGYRGLVPLRLFLSNIMITVIPQQIAISDGFNAFDDAGNLAQASQQKMLDSLLEALCKTCSSN